MGLLDFLKKPKPKTLLDEINESIDESTVDTNSALQFYNFAYDTLPKKLFEHPNRLIGDFQSRGKVAVVALYVENCMKLGGLPKREDVDQIKIEQAEKNTYKFFVINFPALQKNEQNGLPILTPISISITYNDNSCRLFVLGSGMFGGEPTLREVTKDGSNTNLGEASGKSNTSFVEDILQNLR